MNRLREKPKVSVYLPTYNRVALLQRAVNSVLEQTYENIELIIVDDGSTDETQKYLYELSRQDARAIIIHKPGNVGKGACASRNLAIEAASGDFVSGLDDDDYFHKDRIRLLMANYNNELSCITSNSFVIKKKGMYRTSYTGRTIRFNELLNLNIVGSTVLAPKQHFIIAGLFDENLESSQDLDMWLRITKKFGPAKRLRKPLYYIDTAHDIERISTSYRKIIGTEQFVRKYSHYMSTSQIAHWRYRMSPKDNTTSFTNRIRSITHIARFGNTILLEYLRARLRLK